jgi:hypothetical protein
MADPDAWLAELNAAIKFSCPALSTPPFSVTI